MQLFGDNIYTSPLKVVQTYRSKLRDDISGAEGDEVARVRIESFANRIRPPSFIVRTPFFQDRTTS